MFPFPVSRFILLSAVILYSLTLLTDRGVSAYSWPDTDSRSSSTSLNAATFTSTTSGTWGDPATWGGAGVPGADDSVVISSNTTVTLDMNRSARNLTISPFTTVSAGRLDMNGHNFDLVGNGAAFVLRGGLTNASPTFSSFNFVGNGTPGGVIQSFETHAGCSSNQGCNLQLRLTNGVRVNNLPGFQLFNIHLSVEASTVLDLTADLNFIGNFSSIVLIVNNGTIQNGRLTTSRLVHIGNNGILDSDLVVDGGTTAIHGDLRRLVAIQSTATLTLIGPTNFHANFSSSSGTLNVNGNPLQFLGNNAAILNRGIITNGGAPTAIDFVGNGASGGVTQHLISNGSPFPVNTSQRCRNSVNLVLDENAEFSNLLVENGSTINLSSRTLALRGGGTALAVQGTIITSGSTIEMSGSAAQSVQTNLNGASYNNLTINNAAGVDIPNPGANPVIIPGTLTLATGTFTPNGNLTMGSGATIARSRGSLAAPPIFGASINVRYFSDVTITTGAEIPAASILNNLVVDTIGTSTVTLNSDTTVNGSLRVVTDATLAGPSGRSLTLKGSPVDNGGTVSVPFVVFGSSSVQSLTNTGMWNGASVLMNGTGSVTLTNFANFSSGSFTNASTINTGSNFLTFSGGTFTNSGVITGNVQTQGSNVTFDAGNIGFNAAFIVWSGTTTARGQINSTLRVQSPSATLQVGAGESLTVTGNTTINGPLAGGGTFRANGLGISNSAAVSVFEFQFGGATQSLSGTGAFVAGTARILTGSTTTLSTNKQMSGVMINAGGSFNFSNRTMFLSGPGAAFMSAGTYSSLNSTVEYNGTSPQVLSSTVPSYFNLSWNNPSGSGAFSGLTVAGLLRIKNGTFVSHNGSYKDIQIDGGASLAGSSSTTMTVSGNWTNNGGHSPNLNTVAFNGPVAQSVSGSASTTFDGLTTLGPGIVNLGQDISVSRILTLGVDISTASNTLTMPSTGTSAGTADVVGNVKRTGFVAGGPALSFGNPFNSLAFAFGGSVPTEVTLNLSKTLPSGFPEAVQRNYTIAPLGGGGFSATVRLHYLDGELNGNVEPTLKLFRFDGTWVEQGATAVNTTNNWVEKSGVTQFSSWALRSSGVAPPVVRSPFDFDGDSKTDVGIFRPAVAEWWINRSSDGNTFATQFGATSDKIVPADYTGDGKADVAFWRPASGEWFVLRSEDFSFFAFPFGTSGDIPVPADYDADGKIDAAVFRPSTATWFISRSSDGGTTIEAFGADGDHPVPADYDGDGKADLAIFRPSNGQWWLNRSTAGVIATTFGDGADKPVQGDYTGDGKADIAFWRPSTGDWFVLRSEDFSFFSFPFGTTGDVPAPGDYDGDGRHDATVFRGSNATWYSQRTTAGTLILQFGANGDRPIPNAFVP